MGEAESLTKPVRQSCVLKNFIEIQGLPWWPT